jgi:tetratricopeptide (TPR) repeat protein
MFRPQSLLCLTLLVFVAPAGVAAQSGGKAAPDASSAAQHGITLAESGHCAEALPSLKRGVDQIKERDLSRKAALDGVRCAMTLHQTDAALKFLQVLTREFPKDPDALYVAVHAYSDLSTLSSQQLARDAPSSYQARELLAESFESQGKWDDAEKEYRAIAKQNPDLPGIHFRLGRILLSRPNPSPTVASDAKQEFLQELKIDPRNAGAQYVMGELARQSQDWQEAANRFTQATKLDPTFGEAFLGLGAALIAEKQYAEALPPLQTAVKLDPGNPDVHYNLAIAYTRSGRKPEGDREFAIHRQLIGEAPEQSQPTANPDTQK